ncbi:unnamed protein product [Rhizophagus irregularis]|nr:unnamed protein product [Rhizophagus irregularis]
MQICNTEFVPLPQFLHGIGGVDPCLNANACFPQYSFFVERVQYSFVPFKPMAWHIVSPCYSILTLYIRAQFQFRTLSHYSDHVLFGQSLTDILEEPRSDQH